MNFYVHPGTGTYMAVDESIVVDLDMWADRMGFTKVSDDLYMRGGSRREYNLDDLMSYYLWCRGLERISLDPPGPEPDEWCGTDPDDHAYSPGCHCQECLTERQAMS
jgi:hypothetical protein